MVGGGTHIETWGELGDLSYLPPYVGDDATIDPLSLVMKGEVLAPGTRWAGSPVRPR